MFLRHFLQVFVISSALALAVSGPNSDCVEKEKFKAMKEKYKASNEKKKKFQKKFKELKKKNDEDDKGTTKSPSPTITKVAVPSAAVPSAAIPSQNKITVPGCYGGGKCNGSLYCCDCDMTENDCDSPATWKTSCGPICV